MKLIRSNKLLVKRINMGLYIIIDPRWMLNDKEIGETGYYTYNGSEYYNEAIKFLNKHKIKYNTVLNYLYISCNSLEVVS